MVRRLLYICTIICSSLLVFLIQPMMGKALLPWFGGAAGVWTSAMVFFQAVLLLGYAYAHWSTRYLRPRYQIAFHIGLLAASCAAIPIAPSALWRPEAGTDPILRVLAILAVTLGLPYFLLSSTGPLVQVWFSRTPKTEFPYRLFAISNLASLAALLMYPVVIEPLVSTRSQLLAWSISYGVFALLAATAAILSAAHPAPAASEAEYPDIRERLLWIALAVCPSILWLAMANAVSQNVAPVPLLWILPLSIYLLSFILCFGDESWYRPSMFRVALPVSWVVVGYGVVRQDPAIGLKWSIVLFSLALFICCMFCHGELARRKPPGAHLTSFYVLVALGGALGGVFVGVLAPNLFNRFLELPIGVTVCIMLGMRLLYRISLRRVARLAAVCVAAFILALQMDAVGSRNLARARNFYGSLQVNESGTGDAALRTLDSGPIHHGAQFVSGEKSRVATTYYGIGSGVALGLRYLQNRPLRVGVIGLGAGTLATYARPGDVYRFYEINPAVIAIAKSEFRFLSESAGKVEVVEGDGRLMMERETGEPFDVVVLDAFSGDSIPTHLLTREAFALYRAHLKPDGVLAVHISNRYLDLEPVVQGLARDAGKQSLVIRSDADPQQDVFAATWVLIMSNQLRGVAGHSSARRVRTWTDDYSNLFEVLR